MKAQDMLLAALTSVTWGSAFVTYKFGLESFSAPQLTALRFVIAGLPVLFVPRPKVSIWLLVLIGLTLFTDQFLLLFFAFVEGMPAGLASVTQQMQVFFTVALAGLVLIGLTTGVDLKAPALALRFLQLGHREHNRQAHSRCADLPIDGLGEPCSSHPGAARIELLRSAFGFRSRRSGILAERRNRGLPGDSCDTDCLRYLGPFAFSAIRPRSWLRSHCCRRVPGSWPPG
jgi:hypothetical protein